MTGTAAGDARAHCCRALLRPVTNAEHGGSRLGLEGRHTLAHPMARSGRLPPQRVPQHPPPESRSRGVPRCGLPSRRDAPVGEQAREEVVNAAEAPVVVQAHEGAEHEGRERVETCQLLRLVRAALFRRSGAQQREVLAVAAEQVIDPRGVGDGDDGGLLGFGLERPGPEHPAEHADVALVDIAAGFRRVVAAAFGLCGHVALGINHRVLQHPTTRPRVRRRRLSLLRRMVLVPAGVPRELVRAQPPPRALNNLLRIILVERVASARGLHVEVPPRHAVPRPPNRAPAQEVVERVAPHLGRELVVAVDVDHRRRVPHVAPRADVHGVVVVREGRPHVKVVAWLEAAPVYTV
mmetsp:Transcript_41840/g.129297  ORF Transcript_41840/g.129297 Transcript_41840/m.129297 type:complete len:351 (-) Transcript_41840:113-1165(-)